MTNYEATRYNWDGEYLTNIEGVNTGIIIPWSDTDIPTGFLECTGAAVSRVTYASLFAVIGTTYGAGNGSTTFNIPDLRDKVVVNNSNNKALASTGGANTVTRTGNISGNAGNTTLQTSQIAAHTHSGGVAGAGMAGGGCGFGVNPGCAQNSGNTGGGQAHTHNLSLTYSGSTSSVLQPYLTLVYIIKT